MLSVGSASAVSKPTATSAIVREEFITDITSSGLFTKHAFVLNPGHDATFPFLASIARNFQMYQFQYLEFIFRSSSGEVTTTSPAVGKVIMGCNYDAASAQTITTKAELENLAGTVSGPPYQREIRYRVSLSQNAGIPLKHRYVYRGNQKNDPRFSDLGTFYLATSGNPTSVAVPNYNLGELWVKYSCTFQKPQKYVAPQVTMLTNSTNGILSSVSAVVPMPALYYYPGYPEDDFVYGINAAKSIADPSLAPRIPVQVSTIIPGGAAANYPRIQFNEPGRYRVTLKYTIRTSSPGNAPFGRFSGPSGSSSLGPVTLSAGGYLEPLWGIDSGVTTGNYVSWAQEAYQMHLEMMVVLPHSLFAPVGTYPYLNIGASGQQFLYLDARDHTAVMLLVDKLGDMSGVQLPDLVGNGLFESDGVTPVPHRALQPYASHWQVDDSGATCSAASPLGTGAFTESTISSNHTFSTRTSGTVLTFEPGSYQLVFRWTGSSAPIVAVPTATGSSSSTTFADIGTTTSKAYLSVLATFTDVTPGTTDILTIGGLTAMAGATLSYFVHKVTF